MTEQKKEEPKTELTKEDYQLIVQALAVSQVQVKDAPRIIEIINKCQKLINENKLT